MIVDEKVKRQFRQLFSYIKKSGICLKHTSKRDRSMSDAFRKTSDPMFLVAKRKTVQEVKNRSEPLRDQNGLYPIADSLDIPKFALRSLHESIIVSLYIKQRVLSIPLLYGNDIWIDVLSALDHFNLQGMILVDHWGEVRHFLFRHPVTHHQRDDFRWFL